MKNFILDINISECFNVTELGLSETFDSNQTILSFSGGSLIFEGHGRFDELEGVVSKSDREIVFINGIVYEIDGKQLCENPKNKIGEHLMGNVNNVSCLKGDFAGFSLSLEKGLSLFTCKTNSKPLFYYIDERRLICASHLDMICKALRSQDMNICLNENAALQLLTFNYILDDNTLLQNIFKLPAASIAHINEGVLEINIYHRFRNKPDYSLSEDEHLNKLDEAFKRAIQNEFEIDKKFNLNHIITVSGGMDSRMVLAYAAKMGYSNIQGICFSQSDHRESKIAERVTNFYKGHYNFFPLDGGDYLTNIDEVVRLNNGNVFYAGAAHTYDVIKSINWCEKGILHTGQLGDAVLGTYLEAPRHTEQTIHSLSSKPVPQELWQTTQDELDKYSNYEISKLYMKGFSSIFNGYRMIEAKTPFASPFLDEDFIQVALNIPPELRYERSIYYKWMKTYMPSATKIPVASGNIKPLAKYSRVPWKYYKKLKELRDLGMYFIDKKHVISMNPFDKWLLENDSLKNYLTNYYESNSLLLHPYPKLDKLSAELISKRFVDKFNVLTLLGAMKCFLK